MLTSLTLEQQHQSIPTGNISCIIRCRSNQQILSVNKHGKGDMMKLFYKNTQNALEDTFTKLMPHSF